jgi:hypothetical protein
MEKKINIWLFIFLYVFAFIYLAGILLYLAGRLYFSSVALFNPVSNLLKFILEILVFVCISLYCAHRGGKNFKTFGIASCFLIILDRLFMTLLTFSQDISTTIIMLVEFGGAPLVALLYLRQPTKVLLIILKVIMVFVILSILLSILTFSVLRL